MLCAWPLKFAKSLETVNVLSLNVRYILDKSGLYHNKRGRIHAYELSKVSSPYDSKFGHKKCQTLIKETIVQN